MEASDKAFVGSIPQIYDRMLVPLIFQPYALDLARRIKTHLPRHVLETAAGTGVVTAALAAHLPDDAAIVATDLNEPMLAQAKTRLGDKRNITWQQADALALPFDDERFDAVACQFGVMFFPDRVEGYSEARRVLKRGGRFFFNAWDRIEENDFTYVVVESLKEIFPDDPPQFLARTPHGYHDVERIRSDLSQAGFTDMTIEAVAHTSRANSAEEAATALCQGSPMRNEIEARGGPGLDAATRHAAEALARRFGSGPIEGRIRAYVANAWH
jgi:ubiquinone/menaquinone biosynthesis C-methylase UbiE